MTKAKSSSVKSYGHASLTAIQQKVFARAVKGKFVLDLGCGQMELSYEAAKLGARRVLAVDKSTPQVQKLNRKVEFRESYFENLREDPAEVILLSWPVNWATPGMMAPVREAKQIVYIGSNFNGSACGTPDLFREMCSRELLAYVPASQNSLIVVGLGASSHRKPTGEEARGLLNSMVVPGQGIALWQEEQSFFSAGWEPIQVEKSNDE